MVRQFRYPYGEVVLELPAGKREWGEDPEPCGRRELTEETGVRPLFSVFWVSCIQVPAMWGRLFIFTLPPGLQPETCTPMRTSFCRWRRFRLTDWSTWFLQERSRTLKTQALVMKVYALRQRGEL